ncbi:hypothetical protein QJS04_geneDACA023094 [Acorus gramineus]|uniref:Uncharacterized protein n=1 Tax=Acorus gramineus TaxID=55184 RepID=A0AAV8ZZZ6_ACOGR|nr:hypothetical protein QJS04_geneDACA023094 [Acorus gramineus]
MEGLTSKAIQLTNSSDSLSLDVNKEDEAYADCRQSAAEASRLCVVATGMLCATPYEDICSPMARTIQFQNTRYMYLDFSTPQRTPACAKFRSWRTDEYCESVLPRATRCCPNVPSCFAQYQEVDD